MTSRTEDALLGLNAALTAAAGDYPKPFPVPLRNEALPSQFTIFTGKLGAFLNILDGDGGPSQIMAGADVDPTIQGYLIQHRASVEWAVEGIPSGDLQTLFDLGFVGIDDALAVDRTLGGVVEYAEIEKIQRSNLVTDGLPNTKSAIVTVLMQFTSERPF
jgi:hypothetical protein